MRPNRPVKHGKLLTFKGHKRTDTHVAIAINPARNGLIVKVTSNVLRGRGSIIRLDLKKIGSEDRAKTVIMFAAAKLAERQNILWKDDHDLKQVALKAAEAWYAVMKDNKFFHGIGTLVPFSPHAPEFDATPAPRVSRASEDDPLTRDMARGRTKEWGVDE